MLVELEVQCGGDLRVETFSIAFLLRYLCQGHFPEIGGRGSIRRSPDVRPQGHACGGSLHLFFGTKRFDLPPVVFSLRATQPTKMMVDDQKWIWDRAS